MRRLLIEGFGDVARRVAPRLERRFQIAPLSRTTGVDLDRPETLTLAPSAAPAQALLHCAPPPDHGAADTRTANLLAALEKGRILPARMVYVRTSGGYRHCAGARGDEARAPAPQNESARGQ